MELLYGILFICAAALLFGVLLLGNRKPVRPKWTGDFIATSVYSVAVICLPMIGIGFLSRLTPSLLSGALGWMEIVLSAVMLAGTGFGLRWIAQRLKQYPAPGAADKGPAELIDLNAALPDGQAPQKPGGGRLAA